MDYVIKNRKNVYIKLDSNGSPVTCTKKERSLFEYSKARNLCHNLPKVLKKMKFQVEPVPEIPTTHHTEGGAILVEEKDKKILVNEDYEIPEVVSRWADRFGECDKAINDAKARLTELNYSLSNIEREFLDILHTIEMERPKDLYRGWLLYKDIKTNRKKRRDVKDEITILTTILGMDFIKTFDQSRIERTINGLADRKYTFRIAEEVEENAAL